MMRSGKGSGEGRQLSRGTWTFTSLALQNWKNFPAVDVGLGQRVFLVGPNASGKTNLQDALRFLRDIVSRGGLQEAVRLRGGVGPIRCLAARRESDITVSVGVGPADGTSVWGYSLTFSSERNGRARVVTERVEHEGEEIVQRPTGADKGDPALLSQTHLEQVTMNRKFRDLAEFLSSVRYLHVVPHLIREPQRYQGPTGDPFGADFIQQVATTSKREREKRLRRIERALKPAVPQLRDIQLEPDQTGTYHLKGRYVHWRPKGAWQDERQFSDGTLRLVGLLWALLDGTGPLLLEEPELSLHPGIVRQIPQMFGRMVSQTGRQFIVSTHSSELLSDPGIGLHEVLLLVPEAEGTVVRPASSFEEVRDLVEGGLSIADAVFPRTEPEGVEELPLFADQ